MCINKFAEEKFSTNITDIKTTQQQHLKKSSQVTVHNSPAFININDKTKIKLSIDNNDIELSKDDCIKFKYTTFDRNQDKIIEVDTIGKIVDFTYSGYSLNGIRLVLWHSNTSKWSRNESTIISLLNYIHYKSINKIKCPIPVEADSALSTPSTAHTTASASTVHTPAPGASSPISAASSPILAASSPILAASGTSGTSGALEASGTPRRQSGTLERKSSPSTPRRKTALSTPIRQSDAQRKAEASRITSDISGSKPTQTSSKQGQYTKFPRVSPRQSSIPNQEHDVSTKIDKLISSIKNKREHSNMTASRVEILDTLDLVRDFIKSIYSK
jgi:hypothetical protein